MAIRLQQHQILQLVTPPFVPLCLVVNVPPFLDLRLGERKTAYTVPVFGGDRHLGYIKISIGASGILAGVRSSFFRGFGIALHDEGTLEAGILPSDNDLGGLLIQQSPVDTFGQNWQLVVWPTNDYLRRQSSQLPLFVLAFGLFSGPSPRHCFWLINARPPSDSTLRKPLESPPSGCIASPRQPAT